MNLELYLIPYTKMNMDHRPTREKYKTFVNFINFCGLGLGTGFLDEKAQTTEENKLDFSKIKAFGYSRILLIKGRDNTQNGSKSNHTFDKVLVLRIYVNRKMAMG